MNVGASTVVLRTFARIPLMRPVDYIDIEVH